MTSFARTTTRWASAVLLASALVACGSTSSKTTATTSAKSTSTARLDRTAGAGTKTSSTSTTPTPSTVTAKGGGDFCRKIASSYNQALGQSAQALGSPSALRKLYEANKRKSQEALSSAPEQIKPDLRTLFAASAKFADALARVNYDFSKIPPSATSAFSTPSVRTASARVLAFVTHRCGISLGGGSPGGSNSNGTTPATTTP